MGGGLCLALKGRVFPQYHSNNSWPPKTISVFPSPFFSTSFRRRHRKLATTAMADQADDRGNHGEPSVKFREVSWEGPVVVPGPLHPVVEEDDSTSDLVRWVDTPLSHSSVNLPPVDSTMNGAINEGRIRDSLELKKYQPPHPLGVRRLSQASAATGATGATRGGEEKGQQQTETFSFSIPATLLNKDEEARRRYRAYYALNVVQPYPNPYGLKRKRRIAPVDLGPCPQHLLRRSPRRVSVSRMPDDNAIITARDVFGEDLQFQEAKAAKKAERRFSPVGVLARKMRKAKGQSASAQDVTEGKGKGKALDSVEVGESASGKESRAAVGGQQTGAANTEIRGGKQPGKAVRVARKIRGAVARCMKMGTA